MKCDPNLYRGAPPSLAVKPRLLRHLLLPPLIILMMIGLGYAGYRISEHFGITTLSESGERQLELHARTVESELSKYTYLPSLLELESSVSTLLADPSVQNRVAVNQYLEGLNRRSRSRAIYVLDTTGRVVATSTGGISTVTWVRTCLSAPIFRTRYAVSPGVSMASAAPRASPRRQPCWHNGGRRRTAFRPR